MRQKKYLKNYRFKTSSMFQSIDSRSSYLKQGKWKENSTGNLTAQTLKKNQTADLKNSQAMDPFLKGKRLEVGFLPERNKEGQKPIQ
jgi:hypothetical protein